MVRVLVRQARWIAIVSCTLSLAGCCASPYRIWQNGWGFNCPEPDQFKRPGPPPPVTTPPGFRAPAELPPPAYLTS
jgi:hypothetical protein